MIGLILDGTMSGKIAKDVFEAMLTSTAEAKAIVQERGLVQVSDGGAITAIVDEVFAANAAQVEQYLAEQEGVRSRRRDHEADAGQRESKMVNEVLKARLAARQR